MLSLCFRSLLHPLLFSGLLAGLSGPGASAAPGTPPASSSGGDLTRQAATALFTDDRRALAELYQSALAREQASADNRALRTSDAILYLYNSTHPDREKFLLGHELALHETKSEELRSSILWALLSDEYYELALLKGENRFNRFTRIFNRASSALSRAALFQPQAAAQLLLDGVYAARKGRMPTDRERRMVYLGRKFLTKHPNAPEAPEVQDLLTQLTAKLDADRARRDKVAGLSLLETGKPATAEFHLERAVLLAPSDTEAAEALARAREQRNAKDVYEARALSVSRAESTLSDSDREALEKACRALLRGDGEALAAVANSPTAVFDSAVYALAALAERNGYHDNALRRLEELSERAPNSPGGLAAAAALSNGSYHLEGGYRDALTQLERRRREFVLTGNRTGEDTAFAVGDAALQAPAQAAVGLPALFFTDVLVRGVAERFRSQVAADEAVDAGARYLRRYPGTPRAKEIAAELARLSRRGGDLERTEDYLKTSGQAAPEQDPKLREEKARALLKSAMDSGDYVRRKALLQQLRETYPDSKVAATAEKEWVKLPPTLEPGSIVLTRKILERDPRLAESLGVAPALLDGRKSNNEIAAEGLAISGKGDRLSFRLQDGDQFYEVRIPESNRDYLLAAARQLRAGYERAEAGKEKQQHRWLPFSLEGGAGSGGIEVAPKIQPYKEDQERTRYFK